MKFLKKSFPATWMIFLALAITAIVAAGCGSTDDVDIATEEAVTEESTTSAPATPATTLTVGTSQTTRFEEDSGRDDFEITLNNVVDGWTYPDGALGGSVSPSAGMKLVVANVTVTEKGTAFANVAMNDFTLMVGGQSYKPTWFLAGHGRSEFPSLLDLDAGEIVTHDLVFEVPTNASLVSATLDYADLIAQEESSMSFEIQ